MMRSIIEDLVRQAALFGPKLGVSALMFVGFWAASIAIGKIIGRVAKRSEPARQDVINLLGRITRIALLVFGAVTALGTLGVNVSALVAGLGLTGFALGFAFRDALSNLLAGILILLHHPFRRADHIAVSDFQGTVIAIDLRYTTLQADGKIILIPNSTLFTNAITLTKASPEISKQAETPAVQPPERHLAKPSAL